MSEPVKELPQTIERAGKQLGSLEADAATIAGESELVVGGQNIGHQEPALATTLNRIPDQVEFRRQFPIGKFRGLTFGIDKHPGGAADVYLEGQAYRTAMLSRESQGPRAVWNALNRLATSYDEMIASVRAEREVAERQLADYQERLGRPFRHTAYFDELTALRDRLKVALSGTPAEGEPTAAELAEQIKTLRASHQVEAAPVRVKPRVENGRRREEPVKAPEPVVEEVQAEPVVEEPPPSFRARINRGGQMSLF